MAQRKATRKSSSAKPRKQPSKRAAAKGSKPRKSSARKASSVEERAKAAGASGQRLPAAKALMRNELIIQRRLVDKWSWPRIAEEAGVNERRCRKIFAEAEEQPSGLLDQRPTAIIEEWLRGYRRSIVQFDAMAAGADNTAAAVGAVKAANQARDSIILLLQAVGHVPHDLGRIKIARDLEALATTMFRAIEDFRDGELDEEGVARVFYESAGLPMPPRELPVGDG